MTYIGHIEHGQVVLDSPVTLPEGAKVTIAIFSEQSQTETQPKSLLDRLQSVVGQVKDLPADFAINHDHYLHGQPKRQ